MQRLDSERIAVRPRRGPRLRPLPGMAACLLLATSTALADPALYLEGGGIPLAPCSHAAPVSANLANLDPGRDSAPGLVIRRGGQGAAESDPAKFQQWMAPAGLGTLQGAMELRFWSAMKGFATGLRGAVEAFLLDCDTAALGCAVIARGLRDSQDWNGGWGSWHEHSIQFGDVTHTFAPGRTLVLKVTVPGEAGDDMWFAYGSAGQPSRIAGAAASDIVIDGSFTDWLDADGAQIDVIDEAGPDDWGSPGRLDVTWFALSTNTVDAFSILMGIDDVPAQNTTVATLIDTDMDGNADWVLVAGIDGAGGTVEIHSCDDTLTDGCGNAVLARTLPDESFQVGAAQGPWGPDTLVEIALPFDEIGASAAVFTGMVSYASSSLLTSPKDAIFGSPGQSYGDRLVYDGITGEATIVSGLGSTWTVRRSDRPWKVRTADPVATLLTSPFDDAPDSLAEGEIVYYVVDREGGAPVRISADILPGSQAVRLGFDDLDGGSAPADAALSGVAASGTFALADGTSSVTVTVTPRDAQGVMLGAGCAVSVDAWALAPGVLAGPVTDHLNGRYSFRVVSIIPGTAEVDVTVEGMALDDSPVIDFGN